MTQGTQGWYIEMTLRDMMGCDMEKKVRMGTHVNPWLIHVMYGKNNHNIVK